MIATAGIQTQPNAVAWWPTETLAVRRFSLSEYHQLVNMGFFEPNERLELIYGLLSPMSPIQPRHAAAVTQLTTLLYQQIGGQCIIRNQSPITLSTTESEPEPDLVLAQLQTDNYASGHPEPDEILLVVEVSDSTLRYDQEVKSKLYAEAGIQTYWIVNLQTDQLECYQDPVLLAAGGSGYQKKQIYRGIETAHIQAFPDALIPVNQIMPLRTDAT